MDKKVIVTEWENCYPSNWKGVITPEAMAHPAKYSSKLIRRIYEHMIEMDWLKAGDKVVDPFGGVALGALDAMRLGLHWYGVELEAKFAGLGTVNIGEWNNRFGNMPRWGSAHLFNGDSRKLIDVIRGKVSAAVSSPPYAETDLHYKKNGLKVDGKDKYERPYMEGQGEENYGSAPGQLGSMKAGNFDASISSPPYDETRVGKESGQEHCGNGDQYGETDGQLGGADDFWLAARAIVEQVYQALEPGGHAVWVVKDYVKAKKIVPFCDQWRQLCEAAGFVTEHEHHAMLVHHKGTQHTLDGGQVERKTESKSFFRRLAEKKGSPRIDWETIFCMTKL
jgi:tRNA G10  N-methylase Trm11